MFILIPFFYLVIVISTTHGLDLLLDCLPDPKKKIKQKKIEEIQVNKSKHEITLCLVKLTGLLLSDCNSICMKIITLMVGTANSNGRCEQHY